MLKKIIKKIDIHGTILNTSGMEKLQHLLDDLKEIPLNDAPDDSAKMVFNAQAAVSWAIENNKVELARADEFLASGRFIADKYLAPVFNSQYNKSIEVFDEITCQIAKAFMKFIDSFDVEKDFTPIAETLLKLGNPEDELIIIGKELRNKLHFYKQLSQTENWKELERQWENLKLNYSVLNEFIFHNTMEQPLKIAKLNYEELISQFQAYIEEALKIAEKLPFIRLMCNRELDLNAPYHLSLTDFDLVYCMSGSYIWHTLLDLQNHINKHFYQEKEPLALLQEKFTDLNADIISVSKIFDWFKIQVSKYVGKHGITKPFYSSVEPEQPKHVQLFIDLKNLLQEIKNAENIKSDQVSTCFNTIKELFAGVENSTFKAIAKNNANRVLEDLITGLSKLIMQLTPSSDPYLVNVLRKDAGPRLTK